MSKADIGRKFIEHAGVKGMKWGVRRSKRQLGRSVKESTSRSAKNMSDDELRTVINRMQMEQQYSSLTGRSRQRSAGAAFATSILVGVARTQITNAANAQVARVLNGRRK